MVDKLSMTKILKRTYTDSDRVRRVRARLEIRFCAVRIETVMAK